MQQGRLFTVSGLARAAGISEWAVRQYAREQLIPHRMDSAGRRVFTAAAVPKVKELFAQRVASRGRRRQP